MGGDPLGQYIPGLLSIGVGAYALLARSWLAKLAVKCNFKLLGLRINPHHYEVSLVIAGVALIAIGLLIIVGVIRFGPTA